MTELTIASEVLTLIISLIGSLSTTLPFIARFKGKLSQAKAFIVSVDSVLEDDTIIRAELKMLARQTRELIGTKKV